MSKNFKSNLSLSGPSRSTMPKYSSAELIKTTDIGHYFFPLFYAGERGALGMWSKQIGQGHIKRRVENEGKKVHVLEMVNAHSNYGTSITIPKTEWQALHVTLPHFVMVCRGFRRNFSFDILVLDSKGHRRRFTFATWFNPGNLKKFPFLCQVPLKLEIGWQEIHVDLMDLLRSTYRSRYVETLRIQVNANCRLRQIFFCDDQVINNELQIPSMRIFENMKLLSTEFGPLNHPDYLETGPERRRDHQLPDPSPLPPVSRIERDMAALQLERFRELTFNNTKSVQSHYRTYFRNLLEEQQQSKSKTSNVSKTEDLTNVAARMPVDVVVSEVLAGENDEEVTEKAREGVPIPLNMVRPVNLMDIINKGKLQQQQQQSKTPSDSNTQMDNSTGNSSYPGSGIYNSPPDTGRPRSGTTEREPHYFRHASPFPPSKSK